MKSTKRSSSSLQSVIKPSMMVSPPSSSLSDEQPRDESEYSINSITLDLEKLCESIQTTAMLLARIGTAEDSKEIRTEIQQLKKYTQNVIQDIEHRLINLEVENPDQQFLKFKTDFNRLKQLRDEYFKKKLKQLELKYPKTNLKNKSIPTNPLVALYKKHWKETQNAFCDKYGIDPMVFASWLSGIAESKESENAVRKFIASKEQSEQKNPSEREELFTILNSQENSSMYNSAEQQQQIVLQDEFIFLPYKEDEDELQDLRNLHKDLRDLYQISQDLHQEVQVQGEKVVQVQNNVEKAELSVKQGTRYLQEAKKIGAFSAIVVGGAVGGLVLGGPIGAVVGIKAGAILGASAGVGGLIVGATSGGLIGKFATDIGNSLSGVYSKVTAPFMSKKGTNTATSASSTTSNN
ncbi:hypothetical protein FDP41_000621 [Naegleria fowleri]|uniref:t-SNARE coiled-coil homology domain-containing protein n=1 Tax=Naegleria fowleri TaxID=5763 RepID=A0A6A5CCB0_NAEFO|nr:uncharacterized protein FDP41_000621 [Naegleria fowleri]KAF0984722.1 hypothetical protein FDP41_000621 [Naegleria fowleri]CAG4716637.1 unnamed protein product [Naegleria fowleri]